MKHTPGPWKWSASCDDPECLHHRELHQSKFDVGIEDSILYHGGNWPMLPGDMALIAAAPDMLVALKALARTAKETTKDIIAFEGATELDAKIDKALAVIAKAEGKG